MSAPYAERAQVALAESKIKQARYYNVGAKDKPIMKEGQSVRVKLTNNILQAQQWSPGVIKAVRPFRSYDDVQLADGTVRRRTWRHVKFSSELPIIVNDDTESSEPLRKSLTVPCLPVTAAPTQPDATYRRLGL